MRAPLKSKSDYQALEAHVRGMREPEKYSLMLLLSYRLGLRPIELAQLNTNQFRDGELRIRIGSTKGKRGRSLPTSPEILRALARYMQGREGSVFLNRDGKPFDAAGITKAMKRLYGEAGQKGSCYSGRRTLLTELVERNVNILTVQGIAGHASPQTTLSYVGVSPAMMSKALYG